jgi:sulfur carrier protein
LYRGRPEPTSTPPADPADAGCDARVELVLNGQAQEIDAANVAALVEALGLDARKVAVERNLEIVPRSLYLATALADGDRIEIVHFIGGG